ncbi:unnamed protein product [Closterium sp. NIES-54]
MVAGVEVSVAAVEAEEAAAVAEGAEAAESGEGGGGGGGGGGSGGAGRGSAQRGGSGGGQRQQQQRSRETPAGVAIFDLDYDAILAAMYAVSTSDEGDCYLCLPPDLGIEAAALGAGETAALGASASAAPGAGESALSGTASAQALHTFTLDSGASRSFFPDRTTLTPLSRPVAVSLADPYGGPVRASLSTVLPCPAAPSGTLSGLYLPSFSTNLVSGADLQDQGVDQFTPASQRVTHCTCARTGRHLATFTRRPGLSLYTLSTESPPVTEAGQVAASSHVFAAASGSGPESAPCSCRLLSHQTLLWHHRLGHPSLPRLRGMVELRRWTAHQLNLQPRVSLPETSPTLRWTGKVGDASAFRVWGSRAFVRDLSADKLSPRAVPCVFLGFPPDAPGWQFYHPTSRRVLSSQDVTFDESVPYYRLFPYRTAPLSPPPLFLAPGPPPVDPLPPQGPAPSGVSQVDAVEPVEVAVDSGAARGAEPAGAGSGGAEPGGAESRGAGPGGAESGGAEPWGTESRGAVPGGAEPGGAEPGGAGRAAGAGSSTVAIGPGGARTGGTGAVGTGGAAGAVGVGPAGGTAGAAGGTGATGPARVGAAGASGAAGAGAAWGVGAGGSTDAGTSAGAGVGAVGAGGAAGAGAAAWGTGAVPAGSGGIARPRSYFVPLLEQVLGLPPSSGPAPPLECPQRVQSQSQLQPVSPLPAPSPYTGPTGGLAERCEPASRPASPVRSARTSGRAPRPRPPAVPGTHQMAMRPSTAPLRVPLPSPPESSLPALADPESDSLRAASPTVTSVGKAARPGNRYGSMRRLSAEVAGEE